MKRGLKYIFKSWWRFGSGGWTIVPVMIAAVMGVLPFIKHVPIGDEDYLFPKIFLFFTAIFVTCIGMICGCRDLAMNKLARSFPIAKELYTRSVPAFILICGVGASAVLMCAYVIFLAVIGAETAQFSDTLIIGAIMCGSLLIFMPLCANKPVGGLLGMYPSIIPIIAVMLLCGKETRLNGFGVPLPVSAAAFAGAVIIGAVFAFWISAVVFVRSEDKINTQLTVNSR